MTGNPIVQGLVYWMRLPLVQINLNGETFTCLRLWQYLLYGVFEYYTLYYPRSIF